VDWEAIKHEYITTDLSYRKLAEKHNAPLSSLMARGAKEGWVALREQRKSDTVAKIIDLESDKQAERMKRLLTVSDQLLNAVEDAVKQFQARELMLEKSALKSLSGAIKDIKDIQNIKSQLDIEEQKARIAILKKQAETDNVVDKSVNVQFAGELDLYSR
jgi:hypothetical protein